ncbi:MAG: hypothetical protein CMP00_05945 [Woeseiaceae bacterium]|nr:hypothetical protein [Woeseiaceae bacterium]
MIISQIILRQKGKEAHPLVIHKPVQLGTSQNCDIKIEGPGNSIFAEFLVTDQELVIRNIGNSKVIYINGGILLDHMILKVGDQIEIFGSTIDIDCKNDEIVLSLDIEGSTYITKPPIFEDSVEVIQAQKYKKNVSVNKIDNVSFSNQKWKYLVGSFIFLLISLAYFIFNSYSVKFNVIPSDIDNLSIKGGWFKIALGDRVLMKEGSYFLNIEKEGYYPINQSFVVGENQDLNITVNLKELPGLISIYSQLEGSSTITLADSVAINSLIESKKMEPGQYLLTIESERFLPFEDTIQVIGKNIQQHIYVDLIPKWAKISIDSIPSGATVINDSTEIGYTPTDIELIEGNHELSIMKDGFKTQDLNISVTANSAQKLERIILAPANAQLSVDTIPQGANIKVNNRYRGQTPMILSLLPDEEYIIEFSISGFNSQQRKVRLGQAQNEAIKIDLAARLGNVIISVEPKDAEIYINNQKQGSGFLDINLPTTNHELTIKREGFGSYKRKILPRLNYPQKINISLLSDEEIRLSNLEYQITNSQGQVMKRIEPGIFTMGASRREMGRRANEVIQSVQLTKPFYIGVKEVTNKEFSKFRALDSSISDIHPSLLADNNPVVSIDWSDAVEYCNWLSSIEGLDPVYTKRFEKWEKIKPMPNGYRLPTEAEWAWAIRYEAKKSTTAFPWGNRLPPRRNFGNFADVAAKNITLNIISNYNDGYASTSPVGTFKPNSLGIYDGSGNVSEWISDYYSIATPGLSQVSVDPDGPNYGNNYVIRGSSWRHANITNLRGSYRDFGSSGKIDVGFRLARNSSD